MSTNINYMYMNLKPNQHKIISFNTTTMTSLGFIAPPLNLAPLPSPPLSILINHQFNYSEKCFVYLLRCNKCFKKHVGPTLDEFHQRWNNYKSNDRKFQRLEPCMQEHLFSHFSMAGHNGFLDDGYKEREDY